MSLKRLTALWGIISKELHSWQVEVERLIAHVFVLRNKWQCRCPGGFPPAVRAEEELKGCVPMPVGRRWNHDSCEMEPFYHVPYGRVSFYVAGREWSSRMESDRGWVGRRHWKAGEIKKVKGKGKTQEGGRMRRKTVRWWRQRNGAVWPGNKGEKEWEAEKEVRSIDSPSSDALLSRCINPHLLYTQQHDRGSSMTKSTAEHKPVKTASASDRHVLYCGVAFGFWQARSQRPRKAENIMAMWALVHVCFCLFVCLRWD